MTANSSNRLIIFDTTLRDGEQSPGASMTKDQKIRIAKQLERLKVDVIEAGFAASSQGDFEAIKAIAALVKDSTVCSLSRANDRDISRAAEALAPASRKRIHTFIATSSLHMEKKLRMTPDRAGKAGGPVCAPVYRRCRVQPGRWQPLRHGFSMPGNRGGNRGRRNHHQFCRYRRIRRS
jgi:hypothetical protein